MHISRRGFLGCAASASAAGLAGVAGFGGLAAIPQLQSECLLAIPGPASPLSESATGYAAALSASRISFQRTSSQPIAFAPTIIFPAAVTTDATSLGKVREQIEDGARVLYESAASYLGPQDFGFHKRIIRSVFGLSLHDPVHLWDSADSLRKSPYVDYHWPVVTKIRDFSRAIPVTPADGETVAWLQGLPVAAKRRIGKGTLVYLGSPLGPHFLSGDREAIRWLRAFCAAS